MDMRNTTHSTVTTDVASVGTAFDAAKYHEHQMRFSNLNPTANFKGWVYSIHVQLASIVTAAELTVSLSLDAAGDYKIMPDTTATIATGITTSTDGAIAIKYDLPVFQILDAGNDNDSLYVHFKTDAGTVTIDQSTITWRR